MREAEHSDPVQGYTAAEQQIAILQHVHVYTVANILVMSY